MKRNGKKAIDDSGIHGKRGWVAGSAMEFRRSGLQHDSHRSGEAKA